MRSKNGFTLVEMLAMLVVLGILMSITVPNITGILEQAKVNKYKDDVQKMIDTAKMKVVNNKEIKNQAKDNCIVLYLSYLDDNNELQKGPNEGTYVQDNSFVIIKREENTFKYYFRLIEEKAGKFGGVVELKDYTEFTNNPKNNIKEKEESFRNSNEIINDKCGDKISEYK